MLTYGGLKQHVILALGGQPSVVTGVTRDQRIAEIINQAANYLFSKPWRFRERTARPVSLTANQNWAPLPGDAEEILSLTCKAGLGWRVELTTPEHIELLRTATEPSLTTGTYYAAMTRPWASSGTTPLVDGSGMPAVRLDIFPAPSTTNSDAVIIRYRSAWVAVSDSTDSTYQIPVPAYVEPLLIAYARAFGLAYEDEGLSARLIEIDNGPLYNTAAIKDGIQQRDYGRLPTNRVGPFRRESCSVSPGVCAGSLTPSTATSNIRWRGQWNANDSYVDGDVVRSGGSIYICVTDNLNAAPPSSQWELMVTDGADGTAGLDGTDINVSAFKLLGNWKATTQPVMEISVGTGLQLVGSTLQSAVNISDYVLDTRSLNSGTGITGGGDLSADRTFAVDFATSGTPSNTKAVRADDSRLSDARTPTAHTHPTSDITNLDVVLQDHIDNLNTINNTIASFANSVYINAAVGTDAATGEIVTGDDSRLTDSRTPAAHTHPTSDITNLDTTLSGLSSAQYVVLSGSADLSAERVLTAGNHVSVVDGTTTATVDWKYNPKKRAILESECNASGALTALSNGSGASTTYTTTSSATYQSVGSQATGSTNTGRTCLGSASMAQVIFGQGEMTFTAIVRIPQLSTSAERFIWQFGFFDNLAGTQIDGAWIEYSDDLNSGKFRCCTSAASTAATPVDSGVTVAIDTWYYIEINVNAAANSVKFYIDGSLKATMTSNIPSGTGQTTGFGVNLRKTLGVNNRTALIDYVGLVLETAR